MDFKYHGIILGKFDVAEADRIYTFYTQEEGKVRVLAKGVRKPQAKLAGFLEPITYGEIFISKNQGRGSITGALTLNSFSAIKSNLEATTRVFYIFKILEKLITQQERDEKVFRLLLAYLETLEKLSSENNEENIMDITTLGFLFKLLDGLGYKLEVEKCVSCGKKLKPEDNFFSAGQGGVMCQDCARSVAERLKITPGAIKLVRIFLKNKIENFIKIKAEKENIRNLKIIANEAVRWVTN